MVKRFLLAGIGPIHPDDGAFMYVLAADYDALLSVLRQCVLVIEHVAHGVRDHACEDAALAAAAPYLERKEEV